MEEEVLECPACGSVLKSEDEFCPTCGVIFIEDVLCENHPQTDAEGVCIICAMPFCGECGEINGKYFLCKNHYDYEIIEGLARVYGTLDDADAEYIKSCLEQADLHAYVYNKETQLGGATIVSTLFVGQGDSGNHIANEIKVLVPPQEVPDAEKVISDIRSAEKEAEKDDIEDTGSKEDPQFDKPQ